MKCVCLNEKVKAQYWDEEHEEWLLKETTIEDVLSVCDDYTEIDVPAKHGEWLYRKFEVFGHEYAGNCYCSACGMDAPTDDGCEYMTKYCPNCGAKMDEERKEE